jgi:hypothetical protein
MSQMYIVLKYNFYSSPVCDTHHPCAYQIETSVVFLGVEAMVRAIPKTVSRKNSIFGKSQAGKDEGKGNLGCKLSSALLKMPSRLQQLVVLR